MKIHWTIIRSKINEMTGQSQLSLNNTLSLSGGVAVNLLLMIFLTIPRKSSKPELTIKSVVTRLTTNKYLNYNPTVFKKGLLTII